MITIDAIKKAELDKQIVNGPILAKLNEIDFKTIRALREGNTERLSALEKEASHLRTQLKR